MRLRGISICVAVALSASLCPRAAQSRPIVPTIEMLTKAAGVIVVARVEEVERERGHRVATARVLETWKGAPAEKVRYRASKTWVCDVSDAVVGETVVLFLAGDPTQLMGIAYSGMGRLPVKDAGGRSVVGLHGNRFPKELKARAGVGPDAFGGLVELDALKAYVRKVNESPVAEFGVPRPATR